MRYTPRTQSHRKFKDASCTWRSFLAAGEGRDWISEKRRRGMD